MLGSVFAHRGVQERNPGTQRGAPVRQRPVERPALRRCEPVPRLRGSASSRVYPRSEQRDCRIPLELRAREQGKPTFDHPDPSGVARWNRECGDEASCAIEVAGRGGLRDRRLRVSVGLVPIGGQSTQSADPIRLMPFELAEQQVAKKMVVAIRVARPVERDDEEVRVVEAPRAPAEPLRSSTASQSAPFIVSRMDVRIRNERSSSSRPARHSDRK